MNSLLVQASAAAALVAIPAVAAGQVVVYSSDFEADNGGWTADGDWQYGTPIGFAGAGFGGPEPDGGNSGSNAWGTIIGGEHSPGTVSNLTQTFDLTGFTGVSLSFFEYIDSGSNEFDVAEVLINGTDQAYLSDGGPSAGWREVTLDLSAYDNNSSVEVSFRFSATTVVERVGWYVDDVTVSAIPAPGAAALLGLGGLVATRRRR